TVSGVLWAIFQNNAGGAWDNAKKSFEAGVMINGKMTHKGSDAHEAAITGDTVGDPFKDTSGPSMNILIKLTCLIGLVIAPILGGHAEEGMVMNESISIEKEIIVSASLAEATITYAMTINGEEVINTESFKGTKIEVENKLKAFEANNKLAVGNAVKIIKKVNINKG
uniref:sodium/proton-translocating pyrophosphatase n=1 Tax=Lacinutrix sp. TaxID=1937692 RepID=UPI0025BA8314